MGCKIQVEVSSDGMGRNSRDMQAIGGNERKR
jgi:hypothetical protein